MSVFGSRFSGILCLVVLVSSVFAFNPAETQAQGNPPGVQFIELQGTLNEFCVGIDVAALNRIVAVLDDLAQLESALEQLLGFAGVLNFDPLACLPEIGADLNVTIPQLDASLAQCMLNLDIGAIAVDFNFTPPNLNPAMDCMANVMANFNFGAGFNFEVQTPNFQQCLNAEVLMPDVNGALALVVGLGADLEAVTELFGDISILLNPTLVGSLEALAALCTPQKTFGMDLTACSQAQGNYSTLNAKYQQLLAAYKVSAAEQQRLSGELRRTQSVYTALQSSHQNLKAQYAALSAANTRLKADYQRALKRIQRLRNRLRTECN